MKKLFKVFFAASLCATSAIAANVGLEQKLPGYHLDLPEAEVMKLIKEVESQGWIGSAEISIDSLRHRGDKLAYDKAIEVLAKRMQWAIFELSELKRNIIRYSVIVNQANLSKEKVTWVTDTSSKIAQENYFRAMWSIVGSAQEEDVALKLCVSEVCVIEVADAFEAMVRFGEQVNENLNFKKLSADKTLFWRFDRPLLRASFSKAFRSIVPNNQDHNGYKVLVAGVFAPLSVAGVTSVDLLKAAGSAIFNPRYSNIKLTVDEVPMNYGKIYDAMKGVFQANYGDTARGTRATAFEKHEAKETERRAAEEKARKAASEAADSVSAPAGPQAAQDINYWFGLAKGQSDTEKMACAKMGGISADKFERLMSDLSAKAADKIGSQLVEIRAFAGSLTSNQYAAIKSYAESYKAFVDGNREVSDLKALDSKMRGYLYEELSKNFADSRKRFAGGGCANEEASFDRPYLGNADPSTWASARGEGDCSATDYYSYGSHTWSNSTTSFLLVTSGSAKYWACTRTHYNGRSFVTCSGVDLVSRAEEGTTFAEAARLDFLKGNQGEAWMGQTKEEFVAAEIPACF